MDKSAVASIISWSQTLSQLAVVIMAGSAAIIVGTSSRRPRTLLARSSFLLFIPGWFCLFGSLVYGSNVSRQYRYYLLMDKPDETWLRQFLEYDCYRQEWWFQLAVTIFAVWLIWALLWWVFSQEPDPKAGDDRVAGRAVQDNEDIGGGHLDESR